LKTTRRRVANPVLTWEPAGPDQEYRVIIRNQDTGERRAIYDGFRTECRVPPDMRLTPDQLAFRVMARPAGESEERFVRIQEYVPIPRLGDDYDTPADDLLQAEPTRGAGLYRLLVRHPVTGKPLVDMARTQPGFLLPVGLLRDGVFHYDLTAKVHGRWRGTKGIEVTPAMIAAADARADRLVPLPLPDKPKVRGSVPAHAPGRAERLAFHSLHTGPRLLVVVDASAAPDLAPVADPADVARRQWWSGDGSGAVETVALALEEHGLKGQFQLDVLAGEALGYELVADLARSLAQRGHGLGLRVNPEPWRALSSSLAEMKAGAVMAHAVERFTSITGAPPQAVSFGKNLLASSRLAQARRLDIRAVLTDRAGEERLPSWMRWRTSPFAAYDDLAVIPSALVLSTPAHQQDRVVRHALSAADAMTAAAGEAIASAMARLGGQQLIVARLDSLSLLRRRMVRSADQADAWNLAIAESLPSWTDAGWERSPHGFPVLDDRDEIKTGMMASLLAALVRADIAPVDPGVVFTPEALRAWCETSLSYEPMIEQRRGPRVLRRSGVRRYNAAYRQALGAPAA
jgi:hypothetical protein